MEPVKPKTYKNPPVVEVIAEFAFEGSESKPPWSPAVAKEFLKKAVPDAEKFEILAEQRVQFVEEGPPLGQIVVHKMRARRREGQEVVQIGNDYVACHILRKNEPYNFNSLLDQVSRVIAIYQAEFQPISLKKIGLWYVDMIEIPEPRLSLEEFFNIGVKLPSGAPDVLTNTFDFRVVMNLGSDGRRVLDLHVQDVKPSPNQHCKFRFDWHLVESLDTEVIIKDWLLSAREDLYNWFELALTDKCKMLFDLPPGDRE